MPRIKRWFPVSHDINRDPDLWELEKSYPKAVRLWLEILSIADRNEGELPGDPESLARMLSAQLHSYFRPTSEAIQAIFRLNWITIHPTFRVVNYAKYHRTGEQNKFPPDQTRPIEEEEEATKERDPKKKSEPSWPSPELLIELYNDSASEAFPAVEKITEGRKKKAREYLKQFPDLSFWVEVFGEMNSSRFLSGKQNGFRANFDWLLTKGKDGTENVVKVFEGRYRNDK